jgi:hypothetical protein
MTEKYWTFTSSRVVTGATEAEARANLESELADSEPGWDLTDCWDEDE